MSLATHLPEARGLYIPQFDEAVSEAAVDLRGRIDDAFAGRTSITAGRIDQLTEKLLKAMTTAAQDDAVHVTVDAYDRALAVMWALPEAVPAPDIIIEADGEIALDWDEGARRVLSVSVGDSPLLGYAALIGAEPAHGKMRFSGSVPALLSFFLRRIYPHQPRADRAR